MTAHAKSGQGHPPRAPPPRTAAQDGVPSADQVLSDLTIQATLDGLPLDHPFDLRIVPEPSAAALLLAGAALPRHRRRNAAAIRSSQTYNPKSQV